MMEPKRTTLSVALEAAAFPGGALLIFLVLVVVWKLAGFPSQDETIAIVLRLFREHGVWIVALAAFGEGVAIFNLYFPGSVVILAGVISQEGNMIGAAFVVLATCLGFALAAQVNFALGYFGIYPVLDRFGGKYLISRARQQYSRNGRKALAFGYVHPNVGGLLAVAAGIARLPWGKFVSTTLLAIVGWNMFWGVLVYLVADPMRQAASSPVAVIVALLAWLLGAVSFAVVRHSRGQGPSCCV